jgi:toxin ParE1/3/4
VPTIALTEKARSDLLGIHERYVSCADIKTANDIIFHIFDKLQQLEVFMEMGRPTERTGVRELVFSRYPFLAPYQVEGNQVQVLRIHHHRTERISRD